jgi:hypothetical protein
MSSMEVDDPTSPTSGFPHAIRKGFWSTVLPSGLKASCDVLWTSNIYKCPESNLFSVQPSSAFSRSSQGVQSITSASASAGSSSAPEVEDIIVLLPGNPGVVEWYEHLAMKILRRSRGKVALIAMGYAGHHSHRLLTPGHWYEYQDQVELAHEFFQSIIQASFCREGVADEGEVGVDVGSQRHGVRRRHADGEGKKRASGKSGQVRIHVAGHSIGGLVAVHMTCRFPFIDRCFLLTGTVCNMAASPNGKRNSWIGLGPAIPIAANAARFLAWVLPKGIAQRVVKFAQPRMEESELAIVLGMGSYHTVRNVLTMGLSEFRQVATIDRAMLGMVEEKLIAYFVRHDGWVPLSDVELFKTSAPKAKVIVENDCAVEHAWCLHHNDEILDNALAVGIPSLARH